MTRVQYYIKFPCGGMTILVEDSLIALVRKIKASWPTHRIVKSRIKKV